MKTKRVDRPTDQRRPPDGPVCNSVDRHTDNRIRTSPPHGPVSPVFGLSVDRPTDTLKALPGAKAVSSSSESKLQEHGGQNDATRKPLRNGSPRSRDTFQESPFERKEIDFNEPRFHDDYEHDGDSDDRGRPSRAVPKPHDPNAADLYFGPQSFSTTVLPPPMMGIEAKKLWERIKRNALLGVPPSTPAEWLIRAVLANLRRTKAGRKIKVMAVFAGVQLAIARTHGIPIPTHERDIARDVGTRYATLIGIRRLATGLIVDKQIDFHLPEWLKSDWT
jgi:hypothetical protein